MWISGASMKYQNWLDPAQAAGTRSVGGIKIAPRLGDANINPTTGLATDYLNHFNEAIMLLDLASSYPDCRAEFLAWRPRSYREHFAASGFESRDLAIAAYDTADIALRARLDGLAAAMTAMLEAMRAVMQSDLPPDSADAIAVRALGELKSLVTRAGAVITGAADTDIPQTPQTAVDGLMR